MIGPENLSVSELKSFHKQVRERTDCALTPEIKAEGSIILGMIDQELEKRGYNVFKLFKTYEQWKSQAFL